MFRLICAIRRKLNERLNQMKNPDSLTDENMFNSLTDDIRVLFRISKFFISNSLLQSIVMSCLPVCLSPESRIHPYQNPLGLAQTAVNQQKTQNHHSNYRTTDYISTVFKIRFSSSKKPNFYFYCHSYFPLSLAS